MMWAMTSYYNPVRYRRRLTNYRIFRANLCVPLITIEFSFDGLFELSKNDADILIQISGGAVLWQKERLLDIAIKSIPSDVENIAWIDCDAIFARSDWVREANDQLRDNHIIQLFADMVDLKFNEAEPRAEHALVSPSARGIVSLHKQGQSNAFIIPARNAYVRPVSRGFAWAAKKTIIEKHGFYDACIIGAGDRAMAFAMYGRFDEVMRSMSMNEMQQKHYLSWAVPFYEAIEGRIGYVPGRVYHLWHGDIKNRHYAERHKLLSKFNFNPELDIKVASSGAWEWVRPRTELESFLKEFFANRNEDGTPTLTEYKKVQHLPT
jgi:hypothetical protein